MDLFDFLDFLLAWEHRGTPQGLRYFWAVLDVHRRGNLDRVRCGLQIQVATLIKPLFVAMTFCRMRCGIR
jgi:hypothetical protein